MVSLKQQGDTLSLEFSGQKDWNYDLKRSVENGQTKVMLTLKNLLDSNYEKLINTKNSFISSIKLVPVGIDGKKQIEFILKNDQVETFDYLTDFPSKLIIDFYRADSEIGNEKSLSANALVEGNLTKSSKKKSKIRSPANADYFNTSDLENDDKQTSVNFKAGLFSSSDDQYSRFKLNPNETSQVQFETANDFYVAYPLLDNPFSFWTKLKNNFPEYEIRPESTDENKQIRLIQKLFNKKRLLVLRQTTDWFSNKYPDSKYLDVAFAMTADLAAQNWMQNKQTQEFDLAQQYYNKVIALKNPSALLERSSLVVGFLDLEKKNFLSALRKFKTHQENEKFKDSNSKYYANLGLSYCLAKLNKIDDAIKITETVETNAESPLIKAEAAYRKADFLMQQEKFLDSKNQYVDAQKKYPQFNQTFPNAYFNKMEALFRLKQHAESHAAALEFIQKFPQHDFAPYSLTRLGELLEISGMPLEKSVGAFLETRFRYGDDPKTIIARLHLLSTRMKGMKDSEIKTNIEKMNELANKSELGNIHQFKTTMISDGYARRKEYDKAIETLIAYNQDSPVVKNSPVVTERIRYNIYKYIQFLSENNKHRDVLKIHKKYADNWIRKQERSDTHYYLGKAYQSAGAFAAAMKEYKLSENTLSSTRSPASLKEAANLPKVQEINLVQAQSLAEQNDFQSAEKTLDKIKNPEDLSNADQIARVQLAAKIFENKGDNKTAVRYLSEVVRVWKSDPNLVAESAVHVSKLYEKIKEPQSAIDLLDNLLQEKLSNKNMNRIHKAKGEIARQANQLNSAIDSYTYLISNPADSNENERAEQKYQLGHLYFQKGEMKKAEDTWAKIESSDDQFWVKLADEKMKSSNWKDEYKKYIKRIPAAAGVK